MDPTQQNAQIFPLLDPLSDVRWRNFNCKVMTILSATTCLPYMEGQDCR
jgi:hypothetical protein